MLVFAGLSHRSAPLSLRARCAVPEEERGRALMALHRRAGPVLLLSTCGRTELYAEAPEPVAVLPVLEGWLAARAGVPAAALLPYLETATGVEAARRAVRVACGLESAVEGEDEILGQFRHAWRDAETAGTLSPDLAALCRIAVQTGRQARRLGDGTRWTSIADAAAAHAALAVARCVAPRVLVAGTGPMGRRAAQQLRQRLGDGVELLMAGRALEHVTPHALAAGATPLTLETVPAVLARADAAIVALRVRGPVFDASVLAGRPAGRPLALIDLSVPRAVHPAVADLPGVSLRDVDGLSVAEGACSRWDAAARGQVEQMVAGAVARLSARRESADALAAVVDLRTRAEATRRRLLARTLRRLPALDAEQRATVEAMSLALVNHLLHTPTVRLKADAGLLPALHALFGAEEPA